jgi:hypothetical protein
MKKPVLFALLAVAIAVVLIVSISITRSDRGDTVEGPKAPIVSVGKGSASAFPIGPASTHERSAPVVENTSAREIYLKQPDKAKVFALLQGREEPDAKYFAFRAAADCAAILGGASDWNDVAFATTSTFPTTALDRKLDPMRRDALSRLSQACQGFTRPNTLPRQRMWELVREAAAGGHPAAVAALKWDDYQAGKAPVDLLSFRAVSENAFASGDFFAVREAEGAVLSMRHRTPIAGLGAKDAEVLVVAFRLAECRYDETCGASGLLAAVHCAMEAKCADDPASYFLSTLPVTQRPLAQKAASDLIAAAERKDLSSILTKTETSR